MNVNPKSIILQIGYHVGQLCQIINSQNDTSMIIDHASSVIRSIWDLTSYLSLHMERCIWMKMMLNEIKYPVQQTRGILNKYTDYTQYTGISCNNQRIIHDTDIIISSVQPLGQFCANIPSILKTIITFTEEREWVPFDTARNLVMALLGETGELSAALQFHSDVEVETQPVSLETKDKLAQELADVLVYLLRLMNVCNVVPNVCHTITTLDR